MDDPLSAVPPPGIDPSVAGLAATPRRTPTAAAAEGAAATPGGQGSAPPQAPAASPPPADSLDTLARVPEAAAMPPLPTALAALAPGARLTGVAEVTAARQPVSLSTAHGEAAIAATAVLKAGTALVLEVVAAEQRLVAVPVSVDGEPAAPRLPLAVVTLGPHPADGPLPAAPAGEAPAASTGGEARAAKAGGEAPAKAGTRAPRPAAAALRTLPAPLPSMPRGARLVGTIVPLPEPQAALFVTDVAVLRIEPGPVAPAEAAAPRLPATGARLEVEVVQAATHLVTRIVSATEVALPAAAPARAVLSPLAAAHSAAALAAAPASGTLARGLSVGQTIIATVEQAAGGAGAPALPAGTRLALKLHGYGAAAARGGEQPRGDRGAASAGLLAPGALVRAEVVGHDHGGALLARVAEAVLRLPTDAPLPPATMLAFEVVVPPPPGGEAAAAPALAVPATASGEAPRLEALALAAAGPAAAAVAEAMPNTTPRAIANLIAYLFGLRTGDARRWLGERAAQALERAGRGGLIERLGEELRLLGRGSGEPAGEWRQVPLPWHDGARLHFPTLWLYEHHRPGGADPETEPGTRLVVDVQLSRLGPLQIDGFYRRGRFDVAVRTRDPLDQAIRHNLHAIYGEVLAVSGLSGSLAFQVTGTRPPSPPHLPPLGSAP